MVKILCTLSITLFLTTLLAQNVAVLEHKSEVSITELAELNSSERECNLSVSPDGNRIYFMSHRLIQTSKNKSKTFISSNSEIYFSTLGNNGKWSEPENAGSIINSSNNEDEPTINIDGTKMCFQSWDNSWENLGGPYYQVELFNGKWQNKKGLGGGINEFFVNESNRNYGYATDGMAISSDGNLFIVACGPDYDGNLDLYYSIQENGNWSYPKLFNASTKGNERSVFIAADNKTVYFSSNGYGGFGGMDLFKTTFESGKAGPIVNLGQPFNTSQDDMGFVISKNGNAAFLVRDLDIYYADLTKLDEDIKPIQEDKKIEEKENLVVERKKEISESNSESFEVYFNFDKSTLTADAVTVLNTILRKVKETNASLQIIGHTDNKGKEDYNKVLSKDRVQAVEKWFNQNGIVISKTDWKGENLPKVPNSDTKNRSVNRRVEIILNPIK